MDQKPGLRDIHLNLGDVLLRSWQTGDEESLARHGNSYQIWLNVRDRFPHPYTLEDAEVWVQVANQDPMAINLAIVVQGEAVGGAGVVFKEDVYRRSAEIGYWLGEAYWNRGIATRTVKALSNYVLDNFDICRLYAGVFDYNTASERVLEKAGYTYEARLRKSVTKAERTVDELIYAKVVT